MPRREEEPPAFLCFRFALGFHISLQRLLFYLR